jgi:pyruvate,orthophosphate dikinase
MARFVYAIDDEAIAELADPRAALGGKGASLAAMAELGIPVPPAFVISTDAFHHWRSSGELSFLDHEIDVALARLERAVGRRFGDGAAPLLVSVRSGAAISMPGMMDTLLNIGACTETLSGLRAMLGPDVADSVLSRLQNDYARIVGASLPADPHRQLRGGIAQVFRSWDSARAITYRRRAGIDDDLGTAVTVQAMVFGVAPGFSGTVTLTPKGGLIFRVRELS